MYDIFSLHKMSSSEVEKKLYFEKDSDKFYEDNYNGIRIICRESDGYINATILCSDYSDLKHFRHFLLTEKWQEIQENFHDFIGRKISYGLNCNGDLIKIPALYEVRKGKEYNSVNGYYIHPSLVHFVAEWCSIKYSFQVAEIMNNINQELHLRNISLEQKIEEYKKEVEKWKTD